MRERELLMHVMTDMYAAPTQSLRVSAKPARRAPSRPAYFTPTPPGWGELGSARAGARYAPQQRLDEGEADREETSKNLLHVRREGLQCQPQWMPEDGPASHDRERTRVKRPQDQRWGTSSGRIEVSLSARCH